MAIITCPECGKSVSDKAEVCIHCGYPLINPITKLSPKMDQLWEAEQWQECLSICNDILSLNPKNFVAIIRQEYCRRRAENNVELGLSGYRKAIKAFEEAQNVSTEDADRFLTSIKTLFSTMLDLNQKMWQIRNDIEQMGADTRRYQMVAPLASKSSMAAGYMYHDAENKFKEYRAWVEPQTTSWTKAIYLEFPKKLLSLSPKAQELYEWMGIKVAELNPSMKSTIELQHPDAYHKRQEEIREADYERRMASAKQWLTTGIVFCCLPLLVPMMRPDIMDDIFLPILLICGGIGAICMIPYFRLRKKFPDK